MSENRPRLSVVVLLLGFALALSTSAGAGSTAPLVSSRSATPTTAELAIVHAMNAVRAAHGVPPLEPGPVLTKAARAHSIDMARRGYFDHGPFVSRLRRFGVRAPYVGENLAYGSGGISAPRVVQMWVQSAPHRANLLDRGFQRVGVGVAGRSRRLVTADFAGR
jgi:uncharacterized protein YkwD